MKAGRIISGALSLCIMGANFIGMNAGASDVAASGECGYDAEWTISKKGDLKITGTGEMADYYYSTYGYNYIDGSISDVQWVEAPPWYEFREHIKTVTIGDGITYVGSGLFFDCDNLTAIDLPDSVERIGTSSFLSCDSLEEVFLPDSVERLEASAFACCISLKNVRFSNSLNYIGASAFENTALSTVFLPESVVVIDHYAFNGVRSLDRIIIPNPKCRMFGSRYTINDTLDISSEYVPFSGIMIGYADSAAQVHAEKYSAAFMQIEDFSLGDANFDGEVNALDASLVLMEYSGTSTGKDSILCEYQKNNADADCDVTVNALDASYILRYYSYTATGGEGTFEEYMN